MRKTGSSPEARRSFLSRIPTGIALIGGAGIASGTAGEAQSAAGRDLRPERHAQDDWLDQLPAKHRLVFDTTSPQGLDSVLLYATNFFVGNQSGYGLKDSDIGVVIVVRHNSTPFAYGNAIWSKYGAVLTKNMGPEMSASDPPASNPYLSRPGIAIEPLVKRGVHFAVCQMATRRYAGALAQSSGANADAVYTELTSNLVANSHIVPAGIVALNRAQERGYTLAHGG
jgi:intracellular sulfur oxidation DsrE/DsrF family protein